MGLPSERCGAFAQAGLADAHGLLNDGTTAEGSFAQATPASSMLPRDALMPDLFPLNCVPSPDLFPPYSRAVTVIPSLRTHKIRTLFLIAYAHSSMVVKGSVPQAIAAHRPNRSTSTVAVESRVLN